MKQGEIEFQKLHHMYRPKILRYLRRLVGETETEDLTQEVFLKVSQGLKDFKGESQISTWIYRIATNVAIDRLRSPSFKKSVTKKGSRVQTSEREEDVEAYDIWSGTKQPSAEESLMQDEMWKCFQEFVNKLDLNYRTAFILSDLRGMTDKEIAKMLGISLATVKIRLHRSRVTLRMELETHCGFVRDSRKKLLWEGKRP